ncbi:putative Serine/threonine-protein kinase [Triangularia verruculosa]|uniref:cyclin-dependent kinase n=1 Tax=Triangularia verruculosa TaxID=2587418 RepID=A0AAN7AMW2_9PEZI|nr:putative Serine/threonine-protein kinase [Triangularia verruculosa]
MTDSADWRTALTASERYDNIQKLTKALASSGGSAFSIENEAYKTATSREEYDAACTPPAPTAPPPKVQQPSSPPYPPPEEPSSPGIRIGSYTNCHHIGEGITSEVYRSSTYALKVIVESNIAPHNPRLEAKLLSSFSHENIINLIETFYDQSTRFVLVFPYMPLTLTRVLEQHTSSSTQLTSPEINHVFLSLFSALDYLHSQGIIHRDIKPSSLLLSSPPSPSSPLPSIKLMDFGTAWSPSSSSPEEPADGKILDIGTSQYRAPEVLFGNKAYTTAVDIWAAGVMLAECVRKPCPQPLFESRGVHEDGNQLGLILSIFKTIGSPTEETWPEARRGGKEGLRTVPWESWRAFDQRGWEDVLPEVVEDRWRELVGRCVRYQSGWRVGAGEAVEILRAWKRGEEDDVEL